MSDQSQPASVKFGFLQLAEGISKKNCFGLFIASFTVIGLLTFISTSTAFVLVEVLNVPESERGRITGDLVFLTEITQILLFSAAGIVADRIGRKPVITFGIIGMGIGYVLYPYAGDVVELSVYRIVYAIGLALSTGMLGTIVADYPREDSRGRMVAVAGMLNGVGVILVALGLGNLPNVFVNAGYTPLDAGRLTHWIILGICVVSGILYAIFLKGGTPKAKGDQPDFIALAKAGFLEGKNPRIALAYASAFVARADLVILGTFLVLWAFNAANAAGIDSAAATSRANIIFATTQTAALIWIPVCGYFLDRFNRVSGLAFCMFMATLGYGCMGLVDDILAPSATPFLILLGFGQISAFFGATTLIGQEAPTAERGAVVGMFNMVGAIGILVCSAVGGRLFDSIDPSAPFVLIGLLNFGLLIASIIVRRMAPGQMPEKNFDALIAKIKSLLPSSS